MLAIEGEIATTIARTLRRKLSGTETEKLARRATDDPEAYRLYLKGRGSLVGTQQQMDNFKKAFSVCLEAKNYMVKY